MSTVTLRPLAGTNPLGYLAALGALGALDRTGGDATPRLSWTDELVPCAKLSDVGDLAELIERCDADRRAWRDSGLLAWADDEGAPADLKLLPRRLRRWADATAADDDGRGAGLLCSLVAEGALAGKGDAKPTHLDFTAGQQRFLDMARHLAAGVSLDDFEEALAGPWAYESTLPSFGWDARGERIYALRGSDPSRERRPSTPGADWLAFLGLSFLPVVASGRTLLTTRCGEDWKRGWLSWPLWTPALESRTIRSLLRDPTLERASATERRARGISMLLRASIRRTDQGGYGSFGPATLVTADGSPKLSRRSQAARRAGAR